MNLDSNPKDPARKETQPFDPALVDEQGIHPELEPDSLMQDPGDEEGEPDRDDTWQDFKTP